jgi:hypothetical protein
MSQPLHIALDKELYKKSKAGILASEIAILNSLKRLYAIRQTQLQQQEIRKQIFEAFDFVKQKMGKLAGKKLPEVHEIPKLGIKKESIKLGTKLPQFKREETKLTAEQKQHGRSIEEELTNIQRKLDLINS